MNSANRDGVRGVSLPRIIAGVVVGVLLCLLAMAVLMYSIRIIGNFRSGLLGFGSLLLVFILAFLLVGFVSRLVAGGHWARGGLGPLAIFAFIIISRILPDYKWNLASYPRWTYGQRLDLTTLLWAIMLLLALGFAWLGDLAAMRKWRSPGEAKG